MAEFSQFHGAQAIADKYGFTREMMDEYALGSHRKAVGAIKAGVFSDEIVPIETLEGVFAQDEGVRPDGTLEAMADRKSVV